MQCTRTRTAFHVDKNVLFSVFFLSKSLLRLKLCKIHTPYGIMGTASATFPVMPADALLWSGLLYALAIRAAAGGSTIILAQEEDDAIQSIEQHTEYTVIKYNPLTSSASAYGREASQRAQRKGQPAREVPIAMILTECVGRISKQTILRRRKQKTDAFISEVLARTAADATAAATIRAADGGLDLKSRGIGSRSSMQTAAYAPMSSSQPSSSGAATDSDKMDALEELVERFEFQIADLVAADVLLVLVQAYKRLAQYASIVQLCEKHFAVIQIDHEQDKMLQQAKLKCKHWYDRTVPHSLLRPPPPLARPDFILIDA